MTTKFKMIEIRQPDKSSHWYAAFFDPFYKDYVIEFQYYYSSPEELENAIRTKQVYPNMPCKYHGK